MSRSRSALVLLSAALLIIVSSCKNRPPNVPDAPTGPFTCVPDTAYVYSAIATDPNGDSVAVRFDWGASDTSDWTGWHSSGDVILLTHTWSDTGTYEVKAQARNRKLQSSDWSAALTVRVAPRPPAVPSGPDTCFKDTTYSFKTVATDPHVDTVAIRFAWGDGDTSNWSPYVATGESVAMSHAWADSGNNKVTAQSRDRQLRSSGWSDGHSVWVFTRRPPNTPAAPTGPPKGGQDSSYAFTAVAYHPNGITVAVRFAWGDGDTSDWGPYVASGASTTMSHAWATHDTFGITVQARDTGRALSQWSPQHQIIIRPKDTLRIWRYQIQSGVAESNYSSPAIAADGTVYVGSQDDYLYAVNPNGTLKWRYLTGGVVRSSPAIAADGTVYVGSYDHSLYALNPDGTLKWRYLTGGDVPSSPAIAADGTIIFGSRDKTIYALNPDSTVKWSYPTSGEVYSSPAIAPDGTIYCGSNDRFLHALNPGGSLKWSYKVSRDIQSSPAIASDGTVYFGAEDGILYALNPDSTLKWSVTTNGQILTSPAIAPDGTVYFGSSDDGFYALNPDGSTKWRYATGKDVNSSPAISSNGTVYFGSDDDNLYALRADSTLVWWYPTDYQIESSPTIGPDGTVYFVGYDGYLYALKAPSPLASSAWPKFRHDIKNNGRGGGGN